MKNNQNSWMNDYEGVPQYVINPVESLEGRLLFNENLWGPSPKCLDVLKTVTMDDLLYYDLGAKDYLISELSDYLKISYDNIFVGCGSAEVLRTMFSVILKRGDTVLIPHPGWGCYSGMINSLLCKSATYRIGQGEDSYYHDIEDINKKAAECKPKIIIITSPQMPTGNIISPENLKCVVEQNPDSFVIVDECYYGCTEETIHPLEFIEKYPNIAFVRSLSKIFGLANVRIGFGICSAECKKVFGYAIPLHKIPHINRRVAVAALRDKEYYTQNKADIIEAREFLTNEMNKRPDVKAFRSYSNFVFLSICNHDMVKIRDYMAENGISTRLFEDADGYHMRITVAPRPLLEKCLDLFDTAMAMY